MSEAVVLRFRTTKVNRRKIKAMAKALNELGLTDSPSMSQYIKTAILEKMAADAERVDC